MQRAVRTPLLATAAALLGAAAAFVASPAAAQAPQPHTLTLEGIPAAPAAEPLPQWLQFSDPYASGKNDLSTAHLANTDIESWTAARVTDALSFDPATVGSKVTQLRPLFTDAGWAAYGRLLAHLRVADAVRTQSLTLSTVADGEAAVVNSGPLDGHFRWQVTLPVMQSLTATDGTARQSGQQTLSIVVMRAASAASAHEGEAPAHNDLKIDMITLAGQPAAAPAQPTAAAPQGQAQPAAATPPVQQQPAP